ncbi:unnamed protein product [Heligmosomoides polygyrus]|uniref:7TM_GPCR_Srx domain-containing protein n=1 Tax=Heligmosomoides polygyrus TaxID=6339 RepID=A0A183G8A0_HELPZ|nr:unnamed protein product [Heligmosomoides polygyrus]
MKNPFGRLLMSQSTADALLCSTFAFVHSPMVFFDIGFLKATPVIMATSFAICYNICVFSHLFIALNRLVAICFPMHYGTVFRETNGSMQKEAERDYPFLVCAHDVVVVVKLPSMAEVLKTAKSVKVTG